MNHITVIAHGSPTSFARRVQRNPGVAVDVLRALRGVVADFEAFWGSTIPDSPAYREAKRIITDAERVNVEDDT